MSNIENLERLVVDLYAEQDPAREDWADWLAENHVLVVADCATDIANRYGANPDLSRAGALLHDVADARMSRFAENHEEASLAIARELMQKSGFNETDITLTVDDAIRFHSCKDGNIPASLEGKVLATADAKIHLVSDFYIYAAWIKDKGGSSLVEVKQFIKKKIERDFNDKIFFDEIREECRGAYNTLGAMSA